METKLDRFVIEQTTALQLLYREELVMPFLMLLYVTVDVLGFVVAKDEDTPPGARFRSFVNRYMLKHLREVNAHDLWGARWALLHTGTPQSDHSESGRAREILYSWGAADSSIARQVVEKSPCPGKYVPVTVEELHASVIAAVCALATECSGDEAFNARCLNRSSRFYSDVRAEPEGTDSG